MGFTQGITFQNLTFEEAKELSIKNNKSVFVDVFIESCAPCKYLEEKVFINPQLGKIINENFIAIRINSTIQNDKQFNSEYSITSFPTMLFFDNNGNLLYSIKGYKEADFLIDIANDVVHPEASELIIAQKKYQNGNKEKIFLFDYITILKKRDLPVATIAKEFVDLYGINPEVKSDLKILLYAQLSFTNPLVIKLLRDKEKFSSYDQLIFTNFLRQLIDQTIKKAVQKKDYSIVVDLQQAMFNSYKYFIDSETTEEKLSKHLHTKFDDQMFWGRGNAYRNMNL